MKPLALLPLFATLAACATAPSYKADTRLGQKLAVECVASNFEENGCTTKHQVALTTTFTPADGASIEDMRVDGAGESEF